MPAITYAAAEDYEDTSDNQVTVDHWGDAAVATITALSVMVIVSLVSVFSLVMCLLLWAHPSPTYHFLQTLEVNDFRHRLALAYDNNSLSSSNASNRYIASLVSIRYGLRDASFDWFIMCSIGYAIVAGCTWTNADPKAVLVIQGFGHMISAGIMAVASFKFPQWVSLMYRVLLSTGIW